MGRSLTGSRPHPGRPTGPPRPRGRAGVSRPVAATMRAMSSTAGRENGSESSPYVELDRAAWAALAASTTQPLSAEEIDRLRGLGDELDLDEVEQVYLPLSRLLSMYVESAGRLHRRQEEFLERPYP